MKKVYSTEVQDVIREAVIKALEVLDEAFPGKNRGGINDNIAFGLGEFIEKKLLEHNLVEEESHIKNKIINGIKVFKEGNEWYCHFEDYIDARNKQGEGWSEESFCNWCDDNNVTPVG